MQRIGELASVLGTEATWRVRFLREDGPIEFTKERLKVASVERPNAVQIFELTRKMENHVQSIMCGIPPLGIDQMLTRPERISHLFSALTLRSRTGLRSHADRAERIIDSHLRNGTACEIRSASFQSPP